MMLILDTNVISELMKPEADLAVLAWFLRHTHAQFATTAICQAEVLGGLAVLPDGKRKRNMLAAAQAIWEIDLEQRVFDFDSSCAKAFADILQRRKIAARPIQFVDAAIAAICTVHKATIVTRDTAGFETCGIKVINPWLA
jgi:toxin FitB